jgi:predicted nucleic acid-binding protein
MYFLMMSIVLDANLLIVLVAQDPRKASVREKLADSVRHDIPLHAPHLCLYEVANALTRSIVAGRFAQTDVSLAFEEFERLPIIYHPFPQGGRVVEIALLLQRQNAYDASYLALAESLEAELWTLDGPLYRNAIGQGFRVRLLD